MHTIAREGSFEGPQGSILDLLRALSGAIPPCFMSEDREAMIKRASGPGGGGKSRRLGSLRLSESECLPSTVHTVESIIHETYAPTDSSRNVQVHGRMTRSGSVS